MKRINKRLKFNGFTGTYMGSGTQYYAVRAFFKDQENNSFIWDTTFKGTGILVDMDEYQWYNLRFTIIGTENYNSYKQYFVKRVKLL